MRLVPNNIQERFQNTIPMLSRPAKTKVISKSVLGLTPNKPHVIYRQFLYRAKFYLKFVNPNPDFQVCSLKIYYSESSMQFIRDSSSTTFLQAALFFSRRSDLSFIVYSLRFFLRCIQTLYNLTSLLGAGKMLKLHIKTISLHQYFII